MSHINFPGQRTHSPRNLWHVGEFAYSELHGRLRVTRVDFEWVEAVKVDGAGVELSSRRFKISKADLHEDAPGQVAPIPDPNAGVATRDIYISESTMPLLQGEPGAPLFLARTTAHPDPYSYDRVATVTLDDLDWMENTLYALRVRVRDAGTERDGIDATWNEVSWAYAMLLTD